MTAPPDDVTAWFLGPQAEHGSTWQELLGYVFDDYVNWRRNYYPEDPILISRQRRREHEGAIDSLSSELDGILKALKADVPWYHPRYIAHMNSELTLPAVLGYLAAMLYNPNNVTPESAPVTVRLELETGRMVAAMLGLDPEAAWAHITSGGTIANLEALWAARAAQFVPLALRELCRERGSDFEAELPDGSRLPLASIDDDRTLLHLYPRASLRLPRDLVRSLVDRGSDPETAAELVRDAIESGPYGIAGTGYAAVARRVGLTPRIFASAAAHYSINKVCNVLGYGHDAIRLVPVTESFRMDVDALESMLAGLPEGEYVAAVVGILGTTEEGAVDPLHSIQALRERLGNDAGRAFWIHTDAAYGGYVASVFRGHEVPSTSGSGRLQIAREYADAIDAMDPAGGDGARWDDPEVYSACLALGASDSITVDPHKLGYVPYPAGMVAFADARVTDLLSQRAPYLSEFHPSRDASHVDAVGPFVLEGSKPGAAAAACWLAHKSIPLDKSGHGRLVHATLLSAAKLAGHLSDHASLYGGLERELGSSPDAEPFTFLLTSSPDLNIVCFVAVPMRREGERLVPEGDLARINALTRAIHTELGGAPRGGMPYRHPFFVSRSDLDPAAYSPASMRPLLQRLRVTEEAYAADGLFVLRSVVMNPLYRLAEIETNTDYLLEFVKALHGVARRSL